MTVHRVGDRVYFGKDNRYEYDGNLDDIISGVIVDKIEAGLLNPDDEVCFEVFGDDGENYVLDNDAILPDVDSMAHL